MDDDTFLTDAVSFTVFFLVAAGKVLVFLLTVMQTNIFLFF